MSGSRFEFGVLLHTRHLIREGGPTNFSPLWEEAMFAEKIGFDHLWLGDSVTILDKARGDCLTTMAALAAKTERIRIGVVPFLAALRKSGLTGSRAGYLGCDFQWENHHRSERGFGKAGYERTIRRL
jgi:Luciferase-like monooxygenase